MSEFISGASGFIGKKLQEKTGATPIPHEKLSSLTFSEIEKFYFCSAYGNMSWQQEDGKIIQANLLDLIHVVEEAVKLHPKSFVYLSSSSVKLERQTMYSRTKKAAEEILMAYMEKYNLPICIIRPYSVTGVGEQPQHLIPALIRSCLKGEAMQFAPNPTHDFIDVDDVVAGIVNLSENGARGIFELGTGKCYTNKEVLELVEKVTGKRANVTQVDQLRPYDTNMWVSKNFRGRSFGWLPQKDLETSITEMVREAQHA